MANSVPFYKMHGCGNDFVFIDNREVRTPVSAMDAWAKALCAPHTGIGADGLVSMVIGNDEDDIFFLCRVLCRCGQVQYKES